MFKKKETWVKPFPERTLRRIETLTTVQLRGQLDSLLNDLGRCVAIYERSKQDVYLDELLLGAETFHALVDNLRQRTPRK